MALTRITKGVIKPNENYDTHNIVSTGIVTSVGLDVNGSADISGSLSVGGVLTYEDVTSIDSVGLITARSGIFVPLGASSIGIGSQSPQAKLDIYRNDASDAGTIQINQGGTGDASMDFQLKGVREYTLGIDNSDSDKFKLSSIAGLGNNDLVTVTTSGYVGINTSNPVNALEVLGKSGNTDTIAGVTVHEIARFNADTSEKHGLKLALDNTNKVFYFHRNDNGGDFAVSMRSGGQSLERLRITHDGKVGIGTNDPAQPIELLHDAPGIRLTDKNSTAGAGKTSYTQIANLNGNTYVYSRANQNNGAYLIGGHADGVFTERVRILQSGGVGISTTILPYGNFAVDHGQYGLTRISNHSHLLLQNKNAGNTTFWSLIPRDNARFGIGRGTPDVNGTVNESDEKFTILSDGKIGIGTVTPNENLDIQGTLAVGDNTLAVNRPRIILSASYDGTYFRHLFGANLKVDSNGTFTTPSANVSGGGWLYHSANALNNHGHMIYMSAPDTNSTSSTPVERLRIAADGRIGIGTDSPGSNKNLHILDQTDRCQVLLESGGNESTQLWLKNPKRIWKISNHYDDDSFKLTDDSDERLRIDVDGHVLPGLDNDQDLGSSSKRWANVYTADLQLSNKGSANDVDGTWGQYIIQEGEDDLFLINKRNGKKYKFMLEEVN